MVLQAGKMYRPSDIAVDIANNTVYVVEKFNHRVSKWNYTPGTFIFTLDTTWGNNGDGTTGEGGPVRTIADNRLDRPTGIVFDGSSRLFLTDTFHNRIRVIDSATGKFTSSVGKGGSGDTEFYHPTGIAINNNNDTLLIADELNHRAVLYGTSLNFISVVTDPTPLSFVRPHGVVFDVTDTSFNVGDSLRSVISRYDDVSGAFQDQFGIPGTTGTDLFFPSSGHGILTGTSTTIFADTRNSILKTLDTKAIENTTNTTPGTEAGQLYYPESASAFLDTAKYVLAANTLNNRVEVFTNTDVVLDFHDQFGSPVPVVLPPIPANWFDRNFKRRVPITINSGQVPSEQTDFPFLFNSVLADLSNAQSLGQDIRFANFDGDVEFKVEVEDIDTGAGTLQAWTKVPSIQDGTEFFMYYNNPSATLPPLADRQAVWSDYSAVYHMSQLVNLTVLDSTVNMNDGTPVNSPSQQAGKINGNLLFGGSGERIDISDSDTLEPFLGPFSYSFWVKRSGAGGGLGVRMFLVAKQNRTDFRGWLSRFETSNKFQLAFRGDTDAMTLTTDATFTDTTSFGYFVVTYNGNGLPSGVKVYFNNVIQNTTTADVAVDNINTGVVATIAADNMGENRFRGDIDEVRISQNEKSADFVEAEFNNQDDPDGGGMTGMGFYDVGTVETIP